MNYLAKVYKQNCKKEFSALKFKSYRNNFYRVINDVFQSFELHQSVSGRGCTVHFVVTPLCVGNTINKAYCGPDHIKMFENDYSWFQYDKNDEHNMDNCVYEMVEYIKKYVIPYFHAADNSRDAYFATCEFQRKHYREGIFLADYYLFCMALKSGLYDQALEHLIAKRNHIEVAYRTNKEYLGNQLQTEYEEEMIKKINLIDYQIEMISVRNIEYIQEFICSNEKNALLNLGCQGDGVSRGRFC